MALRFKIFDTPVAIGFDFFLMAFFLGAIWQPVEDLPIWIAVVTGSVLLHELGHAAVFDAFGAQPRITLYGGGGMTIGRQLPPRQHIAVSAAGPGVGFLLGGIVFIAVLARPALIDQVLVIDLLWVNLVWGVMNLIPFPGVDGSAILEELTTIALGRPAETAARSISLLIFAAVFLALLLTGFWYLALVVGLMAVFSTIRMGAVSNFLVGKAALPQPANLIVAGRYEQALAVAKQRLAEQPGDMAAMFMAANAMRLMARYNDALWGYEEMLRREPNNPAGLLGRIQCLLQLGRRDEAQADLARLLTFPVQAAGTVQVLALYAADRYADGLARVSGLDASDPARRIQVQRLAALFLYVLDRQDEALRLTGGLIATEPGEGALHEMRALILLNMGRLPEASQAIRAALGGAPDHPEFKQTLGLIRRISGDPQAALQPLVDSASVRPGNVRARSELATCYVQLGRIGEARAALETLPGYLADDPFALYARAALARASGAIDEAHRLLAAAAAVRPELGSRAARDPIFAAAAPGSDPAAGWWGSAGSDRASTGL